MAQTFFPITPVDVTPGTLSAWTDVDVSAYVPSGATGVIIHYFHGTGTQAFGLRKNGSTDDRRETVNPSLHSWAAIGIDGNRIFEAYILSGTYLRLVAYTMAGVTFLTNAVNKGAGSATWTDMNCSAEAPGAIGLIFELDSYVTANNGIRKNGSTDNRINKVTYHGCFGLIIGCDASQIAECYRGSGYDFYGLIGYITDGATFNTNGTDVSLGTAGSWLDLAALPANSNMGFIEVVSSLGTTPTYGLRKNGSSENIPYQVGFHQWGIVECDASYIIEGYISNLENDFFVVGYATAPAPPAVELGADYQLLNLGVKVY